MSKWLKEVFPRLTGELRPNQDQTEARLARRVMAAVHLYLILGFIFVVQYARLGILPVAIGVSVCLLLAVGLNMAIQRGGNPRVLGEMVQVLVYLNLMLFSWFSGGFNSPSFSWLLVIPIGAGVLLGYTVALRWTLIAFLTAVAFWSLEYFGIHLVSQVPADERPFHDLVTMLAAIIATGILLSIFVRSHGHAEARAVAAQKALLKERERLRSLAHFDVLTTLPNRHTFEQSLGRLLNSNAEMALIYVDIDRFKDVNDAFGHAFGDALLVEIATRFAMAVYGGPLPLYLAIERYDDGPLLARRGGDEFVVILPRASSHEATKVAQALVRCLDSPVVIDDRRLHVAASVGIAMGPTDGQTVQSLVRSADLALSRVKQRGMGGVDFFEEEALQSVRRRVLVETALRDAIEREELSMAYQPLFAMDGTLIGAEALLRWNSSMLGPVSPNEFIPLAERSGQMRELGRWVLATAVREASTWPGELRISVNASVAQLQGNSLVESVRDVLEATGLPASRLELEITESVLAHDARTFLLRELRESGVSLALDDFGTGFSSLAMLRQLPVERLKIDRSFVQNMHVDSADAALVRTIVAMGRELGLCVLAEGVELPEQLDVLRELGCHEVQGFYLGKPMSPHDFRALIAAKNQPAEPAETTSATVIPIQNS